MLQRGHSGDGCDLASTLCKYDLFVLRWAELVECVRCVCVWLWAASGCVLVAVV